jgi:hypothetical protein
MMEDGIKIRKGMCKDDLPTKIGGEVQDIETALKYKESQELERAISRQPSRKKNNKISVKIQVEIGI